MQVAGHSRSASRLGNLPSLNLATKVGKTNPPPQPFPKDAGVAVLCRQSHIPGPAATPGITINASGQSFCPQTTLLPYCVVTAGISRFVRCRIAVECSILDFDQEAIVTTL